MGFFSGQLVSEPVDTCMTGVDICRKFLDERHPAPAEHPGNAGRFNSPAFTTEMEAPMPWLQYLVEVWRDVGHLSVQALVKLGWLLWQLCAMPVPADMCDVRVENEHETHMIEMDWEDEADKMDETGDEDGVDDMFIIDAIDEMDICDETDVTIVEMSDAEAMDIVEIGRMDDINIA